MLSNNPIVISRGANAPLGPSETVHIRLEWAHAPGELDICCFMVGGNGKVPSDDYMIFYNQDTDPHAGVRFMGNEGNRARFEVIPGNIPSTVDKCVFTATLEETGVFRDVSGLTLVASGADSAVSYIAEQLSDERALVIAELYRHSSGWKLRAVGQGFNGGLAPLARAHGVTVEEEAGEAAASAEPQQQTQVNSQEQMQTQWGMQEQAITEWRTQEQAQLQDQIQPQGRVQEVTQQLHEQPQPQQQTQPQEISQEMAQEEIAQSDPASRPVRPQSIPFHVLKQKAVLSLEKKQLAALKARVAVVLDASGTMHPYYEDGTVQRLFEQALAVAAHAGVEGGMDVWLFGSEAKRMPSVTERDAADYIQRTYPAPLAIGGAGAGNNEPAVMKDLISKYVKEQPSRDIPVIILFFSDGGIYLNEEIEALLKEASRYPLYWQFIGIGSSQYGVLERLDDVVGRQSDNADFVAFDDMDRIDDEALYDRLFDKLPNWLNEARRKGILG